MTLDEIRRSIAIQQDAGHDTIAVPIIVLENLLTASMFLLEKIENDEDLRREFSEFSEW